MESTGYPLSIGDNVDANDVRSDAFDQAIVPIEELMEFTYNIKNNRSDLMDPSARIHAS